MLSRNATKPRKRNSKGGDAYKRCAPYLKWLRGRGCACAGRNPDCGGKIVAAHGPDPATKGMGTKSNDLVAMPLSDNCHRLQHDIGWQTFAERYLEGSAQGTCQEYSNYWLLRTQMGRDWRAKEAKDER